MCWSVTYLSMSAFNVFFRLHGLEENVEVCIVYVESWLRGNGCIPVNFKMEDAATAEISRAQASTPLHLFANCS